MAHTRGAGPPAELAAEPELAAQLATFDTAAAAVVGEVGAVASVATGVGAAACAFWASNS